MYSLVAEILLTVIVFMEGWEANENQTQNEAISGFFNRLHQQQMHGMVVVIV